MTVISIVRACLTIHAKIEALYQLTNYQYLKESPYLLGSLDHSYTERQ